LYYGKLLVNVEPDKLKNIKKGKPPRYNLAKARQIANQVRKGLPLRYAAPLCGIPWNTAREWVREHFPEFPNILEEAHSAFVRDHVGNIEKLSKGNDKGSQWLLERRAREEFSPAYVPQAGGNLTQVLALGDDAIGKLMGAWGSLLGNQSAPLQFPDTPTPSTLLPDNSKEVLPPTEPSLPDIVEAEIVAEDIKDVKPQRLGRPRKYPKKSSQPTDTPPIPPPPAHPS
jgi:hypothetical protein